MTELKFECIIDILKKKGLIEISFLNGWEQKFGGLTINAKYPEVTEKILETINPEKTLIETNPKKTFLLLYKKQDIINVLENETVKKNKIKADINGEVRENDIIAEFINSLEDYKYISFQYKCSVTSTFEVKNLKMEQLKRENEEKKHQEAIEFLNSLP